MTDGEQIGRSIAGWFYTNPLRAKVVAWLIVAAVILGCIFMTIDIVRNGKWFKALIVFSISGFAVWKARRSRTTPRAHSAQSKRR